MFTSADNIIWGISRKADGNMAVYPAPGNNQSIQNRELFFYQQGLDTKDSVAARLVHGNKVAPVDGNSRGKFLAGYDALITNQPGIILTITVADCLPLYFYDPRQKVIALAHAGWRGVLSQIAQKVIGAFVNDYDCSPADIEVFIGPHIRQCHFEVKNKVASQFVAYPEFITRPDKIFIDLAGIVSQQLVGIGLKINHIKFSRECTYDLVNKYFSYRRDGGESQVMMAYLGIK